MGDKKYHESLDQVLVEPMAVNYDGPFTTQKQTELRITNNSTARVAYKWKSNFRDKFRMRPAVGILNAGKSKVIKLSCKPFVVRHNKRYNIMYYSCRLHGVPADKKFARASNFWDKEKNNWKDETCKPLKVPVTFVGVDAEVKKAKAARAERKKKEAEEEGEEEEDEEEEGDDEEGEEEEEEE